jgi:hypothetical protein
MSDIYLGKFDYDSSKEKGMKWMPNAAKSYELYYEKNIIGDFLIARYGNRLLERHVHPIHDDLKHVPPFPPLTEAHKRAKDKGLIK